MSGGRSRWLWVTGAALVLALAGWLALPGLLKHQTEQRLTEALGRTVTIGAVELELFALGMTVRDLTVGAAPQSGGEPLLRVARLHVDASATSIWRLAPVIEALEVDAPRVRLARTAPGRYDVDDLIARLGARPQTETESEPTRFALYNVQVRDGELLFDDRPVGKLHRLDALELTLPFLSNLPAQVDVKVEARLKLRIDGTTLDSGAQATPFAAMRRADLQLKLAPLPLAPYAGYLPAELPLLLERASLSGELSLGFAEQNASDGASPPRVTLTGWASVRDVSLLDRERSPLASWSELRVDLRELQPLVRRASLSALRLDDARLRVHRGRDGRLELQRVAEQAIAAVVARQAASAASASAAPARADAGAWQVEIDDLQLRRARLDAVDEVVRPAAKWLIDEVELQATRLTWPTKAPSPVAARLALKRADAGASALARLTATGELSDREARLEFALDGAQLELLAPYLELYGLAARASGQLALQSRLDWSADPASPRLAIAVPQATLAGLRVNEPDSRTPSLELQRLAIGDARIDLLARKASVGSVRLTQPTLRVARNAGGRWSPQDWIRTDAGSPSSASAAASAQPSTDTRWAARVREVVVERGRLSLDDAMTQPAPASLALDLQRLRATNLVWPAAHGRPIGMQLAASLAAPTQAGTAAMGKLEWNGRVGLAPAQAEGSLRVDSLPVHRLTPWFAEQLPLALQQAYASGEAKLTVVLAPAGPRAEFAGNLQVADLSVHTRPDDDGARTDGELLGWGMLSVDGAAVTLEPQQPVRVSARGAELRDFYSRLVVTEEGRFNLRDVAAPAPAASAAAGAATAASTPTSAVAAATPASAPAAATSSTSGPQLAIGPIRLVNGRVDFTDRFVRPNYSARLTELNGRLGAFASGTREMAPLELRGRAEGTALVQITGQLNPSADPLALDVQAKVSDLELAPLTPYAAKYAGYAIERGKLSLDVAYRIDPDGRLQASNRLVLNQLTFGERVESPSATQLPVLLAVALLKDRHGVIDVDLPIAGSLKDPQFSIGGIVVKIIVNLLTKALTAPFALLAGGGSEDLSTVAFEPGTAVLTSAGRASLEKVAKALIDRPALNMTVTGLADPRSERASLQRSALEQRVERERRRHAPREGTGAVAAGQRDRLIGEIYRQTPLPDKPRNALGQVRDLPATQMEAMLLGAQPAGDEPMRELALERGVAVRDALMAAGVPSARLFLAAPKLRPVDNADADWTPRASLSLATR